MTGSRPRTRGVGKVRSVITPEGIALNLRIASSGVRLMALAIDIMLIVAILVAGTLFAIWLGIGADGQMAVIIWLLGAFVLRNGWFLGFELGRRGATPGKRIMGLRVVARDGGRLTADAVVARNLMRELELFLPLSFIGAGGADDMLSGWAAAAGIIWSCTLSLFLLFNRDRMRLGDVIAGTWVVEAPRAVLDADLAAVPATPIAFTDAELDLYGIYELQQLEQVLRRRDARVQRDVADTIRAKMGRDPAGDDAAFLAAYYAALKARLEKQLLFGNRRENKYA